MQLFEYRELGYGRFTSFYAIIWPQNPQLSRYSADIHRECVVWAYLTYKVGFIQKYVKFA